MVRERNKLVCAEILRATACHERILFALRCSIHLDCLLDSLTWLDPSPHDIASKRNWIKHKSMLLLNMMPSFRSGNTRTEPFTEEEVYISLEAMKV